MRNCGELSIWFHPDYGYYCDACVTRGCSCSFIDGVQEMGDDGRELACCEYLYSEDGFFDDKPLNYSDKFDIDEFDR